MRMLIGVMVLWSVVAHAGGREWPYQWDGVPQREQACLNGKNALVTGLLQLDDALRWHGYTSPLIDEARSQLWRATLEIEIWCWSRPWPMPER